MTVPVPFKIRTIIKATRSRAARKTKRRMTTKLTLRPTPRDRQTCTKDPRTSTPRSHNRCESVKRICFEKSPCDVARTTNESQWVVCESDSGHSNWRRNGTFQCVCNGPPPVIKSRWHQAQEFQAAPQHFPCTCTSIFHFGDGVLNLATLRPGVRKSGHVVSSFLFPVVLQELIPMVQPVQQTIEISQLQFALGGRCPCGAGRAGSQTSASELQYIDSTFLCMSSNSLVHTWRRQPSSHSCAVLHGHWRCTCPSLCNDRCRMVDDVAPFIDGFRRPCGHAET